MLRFLRAWWRRFAAFVRDYWVVLTISVLQWTIIIYGIIYITWEHCITLGGCNQ